MTVTVVVAFTGSGIAIIGRAGLGAEEGDPVTDVGSGTETEAIDVVEATGAFPATADAPHEQA